MNQPLSCQTSVMIKLMILWYVFSFNIKNIILMYSRLKPDREKVKHKKKKIWIKHFNFVRLSHLLLIEFCCCFSLKKGLGLFCNKDYSSQETAKESKLANKAVFNQIPSKFQSISDHLICLNAALLPKPHRRPPCCCQAVPFHRPYLWESKSGLHKHSLKAPCRACFSHYE